MTCLHNHDQILEFLQKIFLKGFQIYQNYLCALKLFLTLELRKWKFDNKLLLLNCLKLLHATATVWFMNRNQISSTTKGKKLFAGSHFEWNYFWFCLETSSRFQIILPCSVSKITIILFILTLKRLGGGAHPSTFRVITLQRAKLSPRHFMTFFFQVSRTLWH